MIMPETCRKNKSISNLKKAKQQIFTQKDYQISQIRKKRQSS
jgi:hypothetical protein